MRNVHMKLSVGLLFFLFCLGTGFASAQSLQAIVLESQGDRVVINRGTQDGVRVGQAWVLGLEDKTGAVIIEQAGEHSASGRLQGDADVGTLASLGTESEVKRIAKNFRGPERGNTSSGLEGATLDQLRRRYKRAIADRTERRKFKTRLQGGGGNVLTSPQMMNLGIEAYNAYQMYDLTRSIGLDPTGLYNPWWLAASAVNVVTSEVARNNMNNRRKVKVQVEVTYWDEKLVDLQTEVAAAEAGLSLTDTLAQKATMHSKRGVDKYTVFEVVMKNVGKLPAQTGDFKYKMFLVSTEGRPISASRVDGVLDKTLQPGDEVRGMVYFPKIVAAGQKKLKVAFEQMYGDRGDLTFSTR